MVEHKGETSNQLFSVLEEWERYLDRCFKESFTSVLLPESPPEHKCWTCLNPDHYDLDFLLSNNPNFQAPYCELLITAHKKRIILPIIKQITQQWCVYEDSFLISRLLGLAMTLHAPHLASLPQRTGGAAIDIAPVLLLVITIFGAIDDATGLHPVNQASLPNLCWRGTLQILIKLSLSLLLDQQVKTIQILVINAMRIYLISVEFYF